MRLIAESLSWDVVALPDRVVVTAADATAADLAAATISGSPEALLRWLWSRGDDGVTAEGDAALVSQLRKLLVIATQ